MGLQSVVCLSCPKDPQESAQRILFLYDDALESFMRQAGAVKGFLQDALVSRADLSGAEIPKGFKQQACTVDGFLQECMVRAAWSVASVKQQANAVEDFLQ